MSTDNFSTCANCGKGEEESITLKNCVACKMVKYCSRDCQKAHRSQHKKECRKRAAELHDEVLFKQPPQAEDCPICLMRMPSLQSGYRYQTCCGKIICTGCIYAGANMDGNVDQLCPFCRAPAPSSKEDAVKLNKKRVEVGDANAMHMLALYYFESNGMPQDRDKALELWHRAGELGCAKAYYNIAESYLQGLGVEMDEEKAIHYWELAAIGGSVDARYNLGVSEINKNYGRALKHFMIAAGGGVNESLKIIKQLYLDGRATRDDYATALQAYQAYVEEIKSDDRDKAAAFDGEFKYYE